MEGLADEASLLPAADDFNLLACLFDVDNGTDSNLKSRATNWSCDLGALCDLPDDGEFDVLKDRRYVILVVVSYSLVIAIGIVGNTVVVLTVAKTRKMWNATNIYIANLALADIFICMIDLPISAYYQLTDHWAFGTVLCHVIPFAFAVVVYTSSLSLVMIAVDRYILIIHPVHQRISVRTALGYIISIAIFSAIMSLPIAIFAQYVTIDDPALHLHRRYCVENWPDWRLRKVYGVFTLFVQFILPLSVIALLYVRIFRRIAARTCQHSRKTRTTKMLVTVVLVFILAWTPFHLFALVSDFGHQLVSGRHFKFVDAMLRVGAMSSSCINPVLYGWMNENYRSAFFGILYRTQKRGARYQYEDSSRRLHLRVTSPQQIVSDASVRGKTSCDEIVEADG